MEIIRSHGALTLLWSFCRFGLGESSSWGEDWADGEAVAPIGAVLRADTATINITGSWDRVRGFFTSSRVSGVI